MKLMEFAKTLPEEFGEKEFIDRVNQVVDLKEIQSLGVNERQSLHDFAQYLADYMLFVLECNDGVNRASNGAPSITYRGPFIENVLTREDGRPLDRGQLENFGLGVADDRFGEDDTQH